MKKNYRAVVVLSGGMDSTTLLYDMKQRYNIVGALSFNYGQRHKKELDYAKKTCEKLGIEHKIVDLSSITELLKGSSLTDNIEVPTGHYAEETMKSTVVPNRNMILLSVATGYAVSLGAETVGFGAHAGDHEIYPDCRPKFVKKLSLATQIANYVPVKIIAPYLSMDKGDIAILGLKLDVPYEDTWTCYAGNERPCLSCGACCERTEAFIKTQSNDPLLTDQENIEARANHERYTAEHKARTSQPQSDANTPVLPAVPSN